MAPTRRRPSAERRPEVALAALQILGSEGAEALTAARLARAVGLTSGALFRHFPSREAILEEAVRLAAERLEATFPDPALAPLERVLALARQRVALLRADAGLAWLLRSDEAALALPPAAVATLRGLAQRSQQVLREALREGAAPGTVRGAVRADLPTDDLLVVVVGVIHTLAGAHGPLRRAPSTGGAASGAAAGPDPDSALATLARLLAPPGATEPAAPRPPLADDAPAATTVPRNRRTP